jgi:peptide deformylase
MSLLEVRLMGDPVLRRPAEPVTEITGELHGLIEDMFDTMYAEEGVGLAAPQVGISRRIIVVDAREEDSLPFVLINPEITFFGADLDRAEEGCLSIPGLREVVERPWEVRVRGLDRDGEPVELEADGLLARILQHEIDHLDGILFVDRVSPLKRKLLLARWQKLRA